MLRIGLLFALLALFMLASCSAPGTGTFTIPAGEQDTAFDAAREVLRDHRFTLERVDALEGVITTRDFPSAGLGTPWDVQQTTPGQEVSDFLNQQFRRVRVTFPRPRDGTDAMVPTGEVEAFVYRVQTPNLRLSSRTWQTASVATDPALSARGLGPGYQVAARRDARLEARIARSIEKRVSRSAPPDADRHTDAPTPRR